MDKKTGYHTNSILCMPIVDHEDEVVGVAQIMNKMVGGNPAVFTSDDEQVQDAVASTRVQGWGDEPCEPTVRLPD